MLYVALPQTKYFLETHIVVCPFLIPFPCPRFPTTSPSSLSPAPPPLHLFPLQRKTGEREDDVWQMLYFDFLSGRLILTHCVSWGLLTVCVGLWFHYPLLNHFFLKNQTITDVATEIETPILEGLSEQVILGGSAISPVCCGSANPLRKTRVQTFPFYQAFQLISSMSHKLLDIGLQ